ncbi:MAG: EthD domain-containing protein [Parvibaculales bacterium]
MPKLVALISKRDSISEADFKTYYETHHVPLIKSLFPTIAGYKRTYLLEEHSLNETLPLESDGVQQQVNVITEIIFDDEDGLNEFFARGTHEDVVEAIRKDEAHFLDGEKTLMYRVE